MKPLRVGIIGAGQAGERHAIGFQRVESTAVVGVADLNLARAEAVAALSGAKAVTDWRALFDLSLDIVVVCLPHSLHVEPTEVAAQMGVHVLMEKPLATTLADAQRIIDLCQGAGTKLTVSFVHRFHDEVQAVHGWIRSGEVGTPQMARETMNGQRGDHLGAWVNNRELAGGGVLMYSAIHGVDRLRWLLGGEVVSVCAQTRDLGGNAEVEESVAALLTFDNGAVATLTASAPLYRAQPAHWETEIYGTRSLARHTHPPLGGTQQRRRADEAGDPQRRAGPRPTLQLCAPGPRLCPCHPHRDRAGDHRAGRATRVGDLPGDLRIGGERADGEIGEWRLAIGDRTQMTQIGGCV